MTHPDESAHSLSHRAAGGVTVREPEEVEGDDAMFEVRLPIASTGEVRNEGDEPLTRAEIDGMARQLRTREIGVFPSHGGDTMVTGGRYSQLEKLGVWADADVEERDGEDLLMATARMPDPEDLPSATGEYRQALAILKEQATRGIPMDASIGWRDDESAPGGVDLMEASIVGIGADPRTNTGDEGAAVVARAALAAGADAGDLVEAVRDAVTDETHDTMTDDDTGDEKPDTTDEQDADDGETTERAPDDLTEDRVATFAAVHYDGMDESDIMALAEDQGAEFVGSADVEELYDFVSVVTGAEYDAVESAMGDLMETSEYDDKDEDEDEDDDEQAADAPDETQSAAPDDEGDDRDEAVEELRAELDSMSEELNDLRSKTLTAEDVDTPDAESESEREEVPDDEGGADTDEQRDATDDAPDPTDGLGDFR